MHFQNISSFKFSPNHFNIKLLNKVLSKTIETVINTIKTIRLEIKIQSNKFLRYVLNNIRVCV